jgi:hypothetical protein
MKALVLSIGVFFGWSVFAGHDGIICRDDRRNEGGSLTELILISNKDVYHLESQYIESYGATEIKVSSLAKELHCKFDKESVLAFCENNSGITVSIHESRETFFDSLDDNEKKKTMRYTDISVYENNVVKETLRFAASVCLSFGG